mmetsp:Transcript_4194/g.6461  ORF Transcript_4194/g.6461 Transcript_4194/m.6461 type:complete len:388 (-) Transcript_4194:47-1210(-)
MQDPAYDEAEHSACDSSSRQLPKQPQHCSLIHRQLNAPVTFPALPAEATTSDLRESMNLKKRSSSGLPIHSATHTNNTSDATIAAEIGHTSAILSSNPVAKRKRVSFCGSTKEASANNNLSTTPLGLRKLENQLPTSIMNQSRSCTALPGLSVSASVEIDSALVSTSELDLNVSPATFVRTILLQSCSIRGEDLISVATKRLNDDAYFLTYSDEQTEAYNNEKVFAVQGNDVEALRAFHKAGELMQTSNRFGESLLHTSCRRGFTDMVRFFINEAGVSPRVRDDMGRTPMHDACWSSSAPNHEIMRILITSAPEMLLSKDKRGHSPFDYARREYWPQWVQFLNEHRQLIVNCLLASFLESPENIMTLDDSDTSRNTPTDEMAHVWQS